MIIIKQISFPLINRKSSPRMIRRYGFKVVHGEFNRIDGMVSIIEWLVLNIGPSADNKWEIYWNGETCINLYFSDETYAMAFKLQWM